eukprot:4889909-Prorocentrum_lima.AAC.1
MCIRDRKTVPPLDIAGGCIRQVRTCPHLRTRARRARTALGPGCGPVSYTHLRAHETRRHL